jgi:hypothetical protein
VWQVKRSLADNMATVAKNMEAVDARVKEVVAKAKR